MLICGIDEAGRGPVLGPLVIAGVLIDEETEHLLKEIGVKDSKLLTREEREGLFSRILELVQDYKIISLTPDIIDEHLRSASSNLNMLEADTTAQIINSLKPEKAVIDLPDRNAARYQGFIRRSLKDENVALVTEHKADLNHPVVSAASILAKVTRDRYIDFLKEKVGDDFGSGYPGDEKTIKFVEKNWNNRNVNFIRKEWSTWKEIKLKVEQRKLFDFS